MSFISVDIIVLVLQPFLKNIFSVRVENACSRSGQGCVHNLDGCFGPPKTHLHQHVIYFLTKNIQNMTMKGGILNQAGNPAYR